MTDPAPIFLPDPVTLDYSFEGHAGAGPSAAERWMTCTASLGASREFLETLSPRQQHTFANANTAARQGTTAHAAAETEVRVLLGQVTPAEAEQILLELAIMPDEVTEAYDAAMGEFITEYVDLVRQYHDAGHQILVEQRIEAAVPLTQPLSNGDDYYLVAGSGDCVSLPTAADPVLMVADLKYGDGLWVDVDENPQVRIYGLGALGLLADDEGNLPEIEKIIYHIVQPRLGGIKTWEESVDDLLAWRDEVLAPALTAALLGEEGGATYVPSDVACQFCPARGGCAALAEQRVTAAAELFDVVVAAEYDSGPGSFPETALLDNARLGALLAQVEGLTSIREDLKAEVQRRLHRGDSVPGYHLVNYTPTRRWVEGAAEALAGPEYDDVREAAFKTVLRTPKQALDVIALTEGIGGDADTRLMELIDVPPKRPVVAPEGDRRTPWEGLPPEAMFPEEVQ